MPPKPTKKVQGNKCVRWTFRHGTVVDPPDEDRCWALHGLLIEICQFAVFSLEHSEGGYVHIQGYLELENKNRATWIQAKVDTISCHFHFLQKAKGTAKQNRTYCSKEATHIAGPWLIGEPNVPVVDTTYKDALAAATVFDGMAIIKENKPRDFCLYGSTIERNLKSAKIKKFASKYKLSDFNCQPLVFDPKTVIHVYGDSNCGKTQFVLAHFNNPLLVSHSDVLKQLSPDHDGIVFDDMSFQHIHPEGVIHLVDMDVDRDVHIRYTTAHIPAGTRKVFTHNRKQIFYKDDIPNEQKIAIDRRIDYVHIAAPLFGRMVLQQQRPVTAEIVEPPTKKRRVDQVLHQRPPYRWDSATKTAIRNLPLEPMPDEDSSEMAVDEEDEFDPNAID